MVHELVRYMKSVNMHGEKIKIICQLFRGIWASSYMSDGN